MRDQDGGGDDGMNQGPYKLFSEKLPTLQLAWDATSLYALSFCPRYYDLTVRQGWRADTIDLDFGIMAHKAMEVYDQERFDGHGHDAAQLAALNMVLMLSGGYSPTAQSDVWTLPEGQEAWSPWGGRYLDMWRCTGTQKYGKKGKSGGALKCPNAKAHVWWPGHGPGVCPECGSPTQSEERWLPTDTAKNRHTLVRLVVWWCEEIKDLPIKTLALQNGKPMTEVNFQVGLPYGYLHQHGLIEFVPVYPSSDYERFVLCGYWDGAVTFGGQNFVRERKTTGTNIGKAYFSGFSPNMQTDTYDLAVKFIPEVQEMAFHGVLVDAAQTLVSGARFGFQPLYRTEGHRVEHLAEVEDLLRDAVRYAERGQWPMRKSQCKFCKMRGICALEPGKRQQFLEANFRQVVWNPLEER